MGTTANLGLPYPENTDPLANVAAAIQALAAAIDTLEGAAWTAFTPAWTGSTTNPAIGNGTIVGRYRKVGKTVHFRVIITAGSTTTFGSGNYAIGLPFGSHATGLQVIEAGEFNVGGAAYPMRGRVLAGTSSALLYTPATTAGNSDRTVTPTVPAAFASGSFMVLQGTYEAA